MADPILEIRNLKKVFDHDLFKKRQTVIDELSLQFPEGQCVGLMGHNGAGKTTTIRCIFGLIRPDAGEILFKGKPLQLKDKRSIGYMPETNKLPVNLTCEEILWHQLRVFNPPHLKSKHYKEAIEKSLKEINLWEHRKKRVGKLSKGMGRRLSWAQATIHRPDLIILDEPMSGLDPLGYRLMSDLLTKLRSENMSIILCTHELWSINDLCDNVHIINRGKLAFSTLDHKFLERYPNQLLHQLTLSGLDIDRLNALKEAENLPSWKIIDATGHRVELYFSDYADAVRWLQCSLSKGIIIIDFCKSSSLDKSRLIQFFQEDFKS